MVNWLLADPEGRVLADSAGGSLNRQLPSEVLAQSVPVVDPGSGRQVAVLVPVMPRRLESSLETRFLRGVIRTLAWAALAASVVALILGLLLARGITAPVQALTAAAQRIASGERGVTVEITGQDELAVLGQTFNTMSAALAQQEELRRRMVADIAHELRTPLSVIKGQLEALLDGVFPLTRENLLPIHEESLLLARLVEDLRDLSLAESGQLQLAYEPVDVTLLVNGAAAAVEPMAIEKGVTLKINIPPNLPTITGDAQRLRQVLFNLLNNALRYTPQGGWVRVSAAVADKPGEQDLLITVQDTGPGIAPDDLPHVFDRFYRGDKARSRSAGGSGLGLAIARQLVEAHGGRIMVESEPGQGATFTIALPVRSQGPVIVQVPGT